MVFYSEKESLLMKQKEATWKQHRRERNEAIILNSPFQVLRFYRSKSDCSENSFHGSFSCSGSGEPNVCEMVSSWRLDKHVKEHSGGENLLLSDAMTINKTTL